MFKEDLLKGKRILVTGGGSGLGKEMSRYFLKYGAEVLICGRRVGVLEDTAKELMDENGGSVKSYGLDIRGAQDVDNTINEIFEVTTKPLILFFIKLSYADFLPCFVLNSSDLAEYRKVPPLFIIPRTDLV